MLSFALLLFGLTATAVSSLPSLTLPDLADPPTNYALRCSTCYSFVHEALVSAPALLRDHGESEFGITDLSAFLATGSDDAAGGPVDEAGATAVFDEICEALREEYGLRIDTPPGGARALPLLANSGERARTDWVPDFIASTCKEFAGKMHPKIYVHALQGRMSARHFSEVFCELCQQHGGATPAVWSIDVPGRLKTVRRDAQDL
jgi:hypothetical protein